KSAMPAATNNRPSPAVRLRPVPWMVVEVSWALRPHAIVVCAGMALCAIRAVRSLDVSNIAADWPGPGTLCTRLPALIRTLSGEPGASFSVNARKADAATPGDGR